MAVPEASACRFKLVVPAESVMRTLTSENAPRFDPVNVYPPPTATGLGLTTHDPLPVELWTGFAAIAGAATDMLIATTATVPSIRHG